MKIRTDQPELAEHLRRLTAATNPSLSRFRGLGTAAAVQSAAAPKQSAQTSSPAAPPQPPVRGGAPQPSGPRPQPAPAPAFPSLPPGDAAVDLLLGALGDFAEASLARPAGQALGGRLPPESGRTDAGRESAGRQNAGGDESGRGARGGEGRAVTGRVDVERATARGLAGQLPLVAGRGQVTVPGAGGAIPAPANPLGPRPENARAPQGPAALAPFEPPSNQDQQAREAGPRSVVAERERSEFAEDAQPLPREPLRAEARVAAELRPRLDAALRAEGPAPPELAPLRMDPQSAAELQTLIALHARTATPYAAALAEIRVNQRSKSSPRTAHASAAEEAASKLAQKSRAWTQRLVLAVLLGLFLVFMLARSCSGA